MKKMFLFFALLLLVAGWMTLEAQQPAPKPSVSLPVMLKPSAPGAPHSSPSGTTPNSVPVDNSRPEPAALYGYVTVTDPPTGQHYIADPNSTPIQRGSGLALNMSVIFRRTANASQTFALSRYASTSFYRNPPVAVWYCIPLMLDAAAGDNPVLNIRDGKVHYDPAKWRFLRLEIGSVGWQETSDAGRTTPVSVALQPVAALADLPDFNGSISGPSR